MIFLLAEINQEIIGILNVHSSHKKRLQHIGELGISVLKNHWNKGIGKHLMDKMIKWAKSSGTIRKINLSVQANNSIAIKLYNNFGFIEEGRLKRGAYINGKFHDEILMGLLI